MISGQISREIRTFPFLYVLYKSLYFFETGNTIPSPSSPATRMVRFELPVPGTRTESPLTRHHSGDRNV